MNRNSIDDIDGSSADEDAIDYKLNFILKSISQMQAQVQNIVKKREKK